MPLYHLVDFFFVVSRRRSIGRRQSKPVWARYWLATQVKQPRTCPGKTGDNSDNEDNDATTRISCSNNNKVVQFRWRPFVLCTILIGL